MKFEFCTHNFKFSKPTLFVSLWKACKFIFSITFQYWDLIKSLISFGTKPRLINFGTLPILDKNTKLITELHKWIWSEVSLNGGFILLDQETLFYNCVLMTRSVWPTKEVNNYTVRLLVVRTSDFFLIFFATAHTPEIVNF